MRLPQLPALDVESSRFVALPPYHLIILLDPHRPRDWTYNPGYWPLPRERAHLTAELRDLLGGRLALLGYGCRAHKVFQKLAAGLLLG